MTNPHNLVCMELRHQEKIIMLLFLRLVQTKQEEELQPRKEKGLEILMVDKSWPKFLRSMLSVPVQFWINLDKDLTSPATNHLQRIQVIWTQLPTQPIKEIWVVRVAQITITNKALQDNLVVYTVLAKRIT